MTLRSRDLVRILALVGALFATGCAAETSDPIVEDEQSLDGNPVVIDGQDRLSADGFAAREQRIRIGNIENVQPGEERMGPLPDPWNDRKGPLPDPWNGKSSGSGGSGNGNEGKP